MSVRVLGSLMVLVVGTLVGLGGYLFWYGKGYSYLSDDPVACTNCHVMRDNFTGWRVSSHRDITCDGCHLPHDLVGKYYTQAEDGFRHSAAFTFADVQVIRIRPSSREVVRKNCVECHEPFVSQIMMVPQGDTVDCTHCHHNVGHLT